MKSVKKVALLPKCWVRHEERYFCPQEKITDLLPYTAKENERILIAKGIPHRTATRNGEEVIEYWNPALYDEKKVTLPLYAWIFGEYRYLAKDHTEVRPTAQMLEKARETQQVVSDEIRKEKFYREAKEALGDEAATLKKSSWKDRNYPEIKIDGDHFKCIPLNDVKGNYLGRIAVFDMNRIKADDYVNLKVPKSLEGWVKGRSGENIYNWAKAIGVRRIRIISIEDNQ